MKPGDGDWHRPFPLTRIKEPPSSADRFTYGDYFSSVRRFLERDNHVNLVKAATLSSGRGVRPEEIERVSIFLIKHGEYYHPSRLDVHISGETRRFVLNVAVTDQGIACMENESASLVSLNREMPNSYIPELFIHGSVFWNNKRVSIMEEEWFENYHEFHLSMDQNNEKAIIVWDPASGNRILPKCQEQELYRQAAKILTFFYHPLTLSKINSWHHAAGDFVLKNEGNRLDVKLITVRSYGSPFTGEELVGDIGSKLDALFVFFVNLTIRMRLDRKDGTGDFAWSGDAAVSGIVRGFFEGMAAWKNKGEQACFWTDSFMYYLSRQKKEDLKCIARDIISSYHPDAPDTMVAMQNLGEHINSLDGEINRLPAMQGEISTI